MGFGGRFSLKIKTDISQRPGQSLHFAAGGGKSHCENGADQDSLAWGDGGRAGMWGKVAVLQGRKEALARAVSWKTQTLSPAETYAYLGRTSVTPATQSCLA